MYVPSNRSSINEKMIKAVLHGDLKVVKYLLNKGVNPNLKDKYGQTILMVASDEKHLEVVKALLEKADPNIQNEDGWTALMLASEWGNLEIVRELLKKKYGVKLDITNKKGQTALMLLSADGYYEVVKYFLERGADPNIQDENGMSAIKLAISKKHPKVLIELLNIVSVTPEVKDKDVETDLMWASRRGYLKDVRDLLAIIGPGIQKENYDIALIFAVRFGHLNIVREILNKYYINLDIKYRDGWTALMLALKYGYLGIAKELLKRGAGPAVRNKAGWTPLMVAVRYGHLNMVKELLKKKGVDLNAINKEGMSVIMIAVEYGQLDVVREFLNINGINLNIKDKDGWTLLMLAARYGHFEVVKELLARGFDPNIKNEHGETALMFASQYVHPKIVREILKRDGINPNLKDEKGWTTLMRASKKGYLKVVKALLAKADPNIQKGNSSTSLMMALAYGHPEIAKELLKRGADPSIRNKIGWTAMMFAARYGHLDIIKELLQKKGIKDIDLNAKNKDGMSAIMIAKEYGYLDIVAELAKHGGKVDLKEKVIGSLVGRKSIEIDQGQNNTRKKITTYLTNLGRDKKFIKEFEKGYCAGISSLWAYSKWLQTRSNPDNKPRDDYKWFRSTVALIAGWDGKRKLTAKEKPEFERFVYHIQLLQHPDRYLSMSSQGSLEKSLEDTKVGEGRRLRKECAIGSLFTLKQLQNFLKTENIIQDGRLIYIGSHNHATSLFKDGKNYYYFNPNSKIGEVKTQSLDEVARLIFRANGFNYKKPSPLGFKIFSFDKKPKAIYPPLQKILAKIDPAPGSQREDYCGGYTGLRIAVKTGSLESARYFLKKSASSVLPRSFINDSKKIAFYNAAYRGNFDIAKEIMNTGFGKAKAAEYHSELKKMVVSQDTKNVVKVQRFHI